jgi:hypothetical protein
MRVLKWIAAALVALYCAAGLFEWYWYLSMLPARIGTSYPIHISGQSDFREGCGIAVFRLDRATTQRIQAQGIGFLNTARQSRKWQDAYHTLQEWKPTPHPRDRESDKTILTYGLACSDASSSLSSRLDHAVRAPGSFYAFGPEKVIVVLPSQRLVVLSWFG